jgi:pimeloyl-ACP methyl ester carboxylesterase
MILVPGLWLDSSSWDAVVPVIERTGHRARPLTLPGMESQNARRSDITLRDHVDAVVAAIDDAEGDVVLVGHSGGGAIAHAAVDARPTRVLRVVYVDSWPVGTGGCINDELPSEDGEVPLPDWSFFDDADLVDLDEDLRGAFRARAVPSPLQVAAGRLELSDERRYDVPVTVIACEFTSAQLRDWMAQGASELAELAAVRDARFVDLPTGHWPQFTRPHDLGEAIVTAATGPDTENAAH